MSCFFPVKRHYFFPLHRDDDDDYSGSGEEQTFHSGISQEALEDFFLNFNVGVNGFL